MSYARATVVSVDKSRAEIETMLSRNGAQQFGTVTDIEHGVAVVGFKFKNLNIKMSIPIPNPNDKAFTRDGRGYTRHADDARKWYEAECRRRWRCLCLALKAKLVAIAEGVSTFEQEFLPYMVCATGETIFERVSPMIEEAKETGVIKAGLLLTAG